jgi:hypothetical protein
MRSLGVIVIMSFWSTALAGDLPRVKEYQLDATFDPHRGYVQAVATVRLNQPVAPRDSIHFYLHGELRVDSLEVGSRVVPVAQENVLYSHDYSLVATRAVFPVGADFAGQFTVYYSGFFNPSKARSPSDYMRIDEQGVLLRAYGYSLWFPIFLEAAQDSYACDFSDVILRTPEDYTPIFAGERIEEEVRDGQRRSRWRALGLDLFAAQCTAQRFVTTCEGSLCLYHYADSASVNAAVGILSFARAMIAEFARRYRSDATSGQYYIMQMPAFGDISSGNVTGITSGVWHDFENQEWSKRALAHELVHSFVHANVRRDDSLYAFAVEGFPSYFHLPVLAGQFGVPWYDEEMKRVEKEYLRKKETGLGWRDRPVPPEKPLAHISADELSTYKDVFVLDDRALLFLNWLRTEMGSERFQQFVKELFKSDDVTLASFEATVLKYLPASGKTLTLWLRTTAYLDEWRIQ